MALKETKTWQVDIISLEDWDWLNEIGCAIHTTNTTGYEYIQVSSSQSLQVYVQPSQPIITSTTEEQEVLLKLKYANTLRLLSRTLTQDWFGE